MQRTLPLLVAGVLAVTGCFEALGPEPQSTHDEIEAARPDLPDGLKLADGEEIERSKTSAVLVWSDTTTPHRVSSAVGNLYLGASELQYAETALELPANVPLNVSFEIAARGADTALEVYDEYGRLQCQAIDGSCAVPWVRPIGGTRAWTLLVAGYVSDSTASAEVPFDVTVRVHTLAWEGPVDPRTVSGLKSIEPFQVTSFDGTALRGHVYLPDGDAPFPTVLELSPYWNTIQGHSEGQTHETPDGRKTLPYHLGKFLDNGYAVALVNLRGTGESDGCQSWFAPEDGKDAYHVIQGLAKQPWSNGNIGMSGISWYGYSQYAALRDQPPALKAVVPSSAVLDQWTLWTRYGPGIISQFGPLLPTYAAFLAATTVGVEGDVGPSHALCPEYVEQARAYTETMLTGDKNDWLQVRDMHETIANSTVPMFVTNGLTDGEGHILQAEGLWDIMPEEKRMMLGQWGHAFPSDDPETVEAWDQQVLDFLDHYLKGEEKRLETGVVEYEDTSGNWRTAATWPPPGTTQRLYLSDATLVASPDDVTSSTQSFVTPNTPILLTRWGQDCPHAAVYGSPPLAEDVFLAGNFLANLTVSATAPNGNFEVSLFHGKDIPSCRNGPEILEIPAPVRRAVSDLAHRGQLEQGSPFPLTGSDVMEMRSYPFAEPVPAGDRLMLVVAGSAPEVEPKAIHPAITVATGPGIEGELALNVVEGELRFTTDETESTTESDQLS